MLIQFYAALPVTLEKDMSLPVEGWHLYRQMDSTGCEFSSCHIIIISNLFYVDLNINFYKAM